MTIAHVSRETRLASYAALLQRWGGTISLSSRADMSVSAIQTHVAESLELLTYLPPGIDHFVDLGSGQGFPALPLAIATGLSFTCIEADRRKAAFLTTAIATLGLPGTVLVGRIETVSLPKAPCVMAQALARLDHLLTLAKPFMDSSSIGLFPKGEAAAEEIRIARQLHTFDADLIPLGRAGSHLVKVTHLS